MTISYDDLLAALDRVNDMNEMLADEPKDQFAKWLEGMDIDEDDFLKFVVSVGSLGNSPTHGCIFGFSVGWTAALMYGELP